MAGVLQHLRSSTLNKRPNPASMVDGQIAINYASGSPGAFFKDTNGNLVKVGPVHVGATAPNVSPASGGTAGNSLGEQWLDTSGGTYVFKIWDGAAWRSEAGEFVNSTGDTMTGSLTMGPSANLIFEGSTDDGFETTLTVVDPTADRTITLPNVSGTVVTTGDSGTVTSTMIADGTIVNADVNASAAIAGTKISPDFGSQTIQTTGVFSHAVGSAGAPTITFTGDTNTGIYSPGADQLAISTGGSGRLFVDASGNVGVGTASPAFPLQIGATGAGGIAIDATNSVIHGTFGSGGNVTLRAQAAASSGGGDIFLGGSTRGDANVNSIVFSTANTVRAKIDSSGYFTVSSNRINGFEFNDSSAAIYHSFGSGGGLALRAQTTATAGGGEIFLGGSSRGDGNVNAIVFSNANTERVRIDSSGRLLVGTSSGRNIGTVYQHKLQIETTQYAGLSIVNNTADTGPALLVLAKSRGTSVGSVNLVQANDVLGSLTFAGADGTDIETPGASIEAFVDGTPGANDMPGRLVFSTTADGASSPTERLRIAANGQMTHSLNGTTNAASLTLNVGGVGDPGNTGWITPRIDFVGSSLASPGTTFIGATGGLGGRSLVFATGSDSAGTERARIDSSGRLLVGASSSIGYGGLLQVVGGDTARPQIHRNVNDEYPAVLYISKARGTGVQSVLSGDEIGNISFIGYDGTQQLNAASITCFVDGTPGTNDMPGRIVLATTADGASSPTERMRIGANGYIRASNTGSYYSTGTLSHELSGNSATDSSLFVGSFNTSKNHGNTSACLVVADYDSDYTDSNLFGGWNVTNNSWRILIRGDGDVENVNNSYGALSDVKLKENIVNAGSQWDDIKALQVRKYNFKEGQTHTQIGLIAQEVELVSPGLVSESPDRDEDGNALGTVTKSVNYSVLYMKAVKALQEAMERIELLEARLDAANL